MKDTLDVVRRDEKKTASTLVQKSIDLHEEWAKLVKSDDEERPNSVDIDAAHDARSAFDIIRPLHITYFRNFSRLRRNTQWCIVRSVSKT